MRAFNRFGVAVFALLCTLPFAVADIPIPEDAPQPLSPSESARLVKLPDGFRLELVAAEPLIRNPSGVCWDEHGRMFVCELHGYNMEGQYDVDELNRTGRLDKVVRRIPAPDQAIKKAEQDQTGTVKRLIDTDGDGVMDDAEVWADGLPACFGMVPARGGVIVVCAPDIVFLADRDGDGRAEVRETLLTGFREGVLERRMNSPSWGYDDWIYVARGSGGEITGPKLDGTIALPNNDFRFKADGSAIEPIPEGTHTFGHTLTASGDRFVISTGSPAIYVAPLPWRYQLRNPRASIGRLMISIGPGNQSYPVSQPHPWRTKRADHEGFEEYYRTRYGRAESAPNGYFTSACSPLVYKDTALPLGGQLLACEPAQNMIHRSLIERDGLVPQLRRPDSEQRSEFLSSSDVWFHPIAMTHAPDGSIVICDFYREIIEDYSAIPRYLQQQYRLDHGEFHGRLWRLTHRDLPAAVPAKMSDLNSVQLQRELASDRYWRRQTSRRLLIERGDSLALDAMSALIESDASPDAVIGSLYGLDVLEALTVRQIRAAMRHGEPGVAVAALRLADRRLDTSPELLEDILSLVEHSDQRVRFQLALSLGQSDASAARDALVTLTAESIGVRWFGDAVLTSLANGPDQFLGQLLASPQLAESDESVSFLKRLAGVIAVGRDAEAVSETLVQIGNANSQPAFQRACLDGLYEQLSERHGMELSEAARHALENLAKGSDETVSSVARQLLVAVRVESPTERDERLNRLLTQASDIQLATAERISAVDELGNERDAAVAARLLELFGSTTPTVQGAIVNAVVSWEGNLPAIVEALEQQHLHASMIPAIHRERLLSLVRADRAFSTRVADALMPAEILIDSTMQKYLDALAEPRDVDNGQAVFKKSCGNCHRAHGIGFDVGPDLASEFRRSEETFVQDILTPSANISAGYASYVVVTVDGRVVTGRLASESPTSVTLRQAEGKEHVILRRDIESLKASKVSLMPEDLVKELTPKEVADVIAWLAQAS